MSMQQGNPLEQAISAYPAHDFDHCIDALVREKCAAKHLWSGYPVAGNMLQNRPAAYGEIANVDWRIVRHGIHHSW